MIWHDVNLEENSYLTTHPRYLAFNDWREIGRFDRKTKYSVFFIA